MWARNLNIPHPPKATPESISSYGTTTYPPLPHNHNVCVCVCGKSLSGIEVMSVRWSKIEVNQCHNDERRTLDQLGGSRLGDFKIKASLKAEHFCRWCDNRLCHVAHAYQRDINRMLRYPPANPFSSTLPWNQTTTVAELYPAFPVLMQFSSAGAACNGLAVWHFDMSNQQAWSQLDIPDHSAPFIAGIIFKPWLWFVF